MDFLKPLTLSLLFMTTITLAFAAPQCDPETLSKTSQHILECYLQEPEKIENPWTFNTSSYDNAYQVSVKTYTLTSQTWPKTANNSSGKLWEHALEIYIPQGITSTQALLFVSGGIRNPQSNNAKLFPSLLNFARIAAETRSIVVNLKDIPNQYLSFDDKIERKEDSIIAYSWSRYLEDPYHNSYWPAHLPMTKAIIKAMDATQQIVANEAKINLQGFVVSGASKRGWATWLAALADNRITAIVPIVIDILNMRENLNLIYTRYNHQWPIAFQDYINEKIPERINTPEFASLLQVEDPLSYLACANCDSYKQRLSIPKYIISASGDDFFVPDSLSLYLNKLPGENLVRVVPNQSHFLDPSIIEESLLSYYRRLLDNRPRPQLQWTVNNAGFLENVSTDCQPLSVKLWEAENPENGDFRLASQVRYSAKELNGQCSQNHCFYPIPHSPLSKGWRASFVEVSFADGNNEALMLTTPAYVMKASN